MKALRFERFGEPSAVLRLVEAARPSPAAGEALVEVRAAAINPSDVKNVEGRMPQTRPPRIPGRDFAGVVVEGPAAWQGVAVWGTGGDLGFLRDGAHAEAVVVPVAALRRKPERLDFVEAAAVGVPFVTAQLGLERATLRAGEDVLVVGAAGAVGSAAVQLAAWRGARVIALVRRAEQAEAVRALGAAEVIVGDGAEPAVDLAFDTTGVALDACVRALRRDGRVVVVSAPPDGRETFALRDFYRKDARLFGVDSLRVDAASAAAILDTLAPGFDAGRLAPPRVAAARPLADGVAAYADPARGKIVLLP